LDGSATYSEKDEEDQRTFKAMADPFNLGLEPRVGREFLRRHPELVSNKG
jgi:hypothetical protein